MTNSRLTDSQRVVVTGLGATTPLGGDVASTWSAMLAGQSGVRLLTEDWVETLPVHIAAPVAVEPSELLPVPQTKRMDRSGQFALIAAREAWADAGSPEVDPERMGVVIASGIGGVTTLLAAYDTLKERGAATRPADDGPDAHAERPGRHRRPRAVGAGRRAHAGQRLLQRRGGDRLRRGHDPAPAGPTS